MTPMRRRIVTAAILLGAIAVAVIMVRLRPEPPRRPAGSELPLVTAAPIEAGDGPIRVYGSGSVRPRAEIDVSPEVTGKIVYVNPSFQSGGRVAAGELLVRIDPSDYENRVRQAEADVAAQRVSVLQAEEEARIAREEYGQFQAREARRTASNGASATEPSPLALREPQLQAARASLARAEAQLADAALALGRTEVTAPFAGIVRSESADIGRFVAAGQSVGRLYASDVVEVVVPLSDGDAALIPGLWELEAGDDDRGVRARALNDFGGRRYLWEGYVDRAEAALDEQTRTIDVVVRIPSPFLPGTPVEGESPIEGPPLLVGQFAQVEIAGAEMDSYFVLPRRALRPGNEVWSVDSGGRVRIVPVTVLQEIEDEVFVVGDLDAGHSVIVAGLDVATNGMEVRTLAQE